MPSTRALTTTAWTAAAVITTLALGCIAFEVLGPAVPGMGVDPEASSGGVVLVSIQALVESAFAVLGAIVVSRQPRNPVGWLLILSGFWFMLIGVSNQLYLQVVLPTGDATGVVPYVLWVGNWSFVPAMVPVFVFLPLLFPTGRLLSPRWRALVWVVAAAAPLAVVGTALAPGLGGTPAVDNPVSLDHPAVELAALIGFLGVLGAMLASIASLVVRFRRSRGVERQQLKWVAAAAALIPISLTGLGLGGDASWPLLLIALLIVAGAVALAMLRYRLYDIDIVINRTLVYGALTATLTLAYLSGVLLLQLALNPLTERSDLAVAGATLAVAALFRPARSRIQGLVDRRFYRKRYDAARTLEAFSGRLREQLDLAALSTDLCGAVQETVQPTHVSLWLREVRL